jgi:hypothetical protein
LVLSLDRDEDGRMDSDWTFADPKNVAVLISGSVLRGDSAILHVRHDDDDGGWQFHGGGELSEDDAKLVSLHQVILLDPSLRELADLPLGWTANRDSNAAPWKRSPGAVADMDDRRVSEIANRDSNAAPWKRSPGAVADMDDRRVSEIADRDSNAAPWKRSPGALADMDDRRVSEIDEVITSEADLRKAIADYSEDSPLIARPALEHAATLSEVGDERNANHFALMADKAFCAEVNIRLLGKVPLADIATEILKWADTVEGYGFTRRANYWRMQAQRFEKRVAQGNESKAGFRLFWGGLLCIAVLFHWPWVFPGFAIVMLIVSCAINCENRRYLAIEVPPSDRTLEQTSH